jgi:hypothetical protein
LSHPLRLSPRKGALPIGTPKTLPPLFGPFNNASQAFFPLLALCCCSYVPDRLVGEFQPKYRHCVFLPNGRSGHRNR